MSWDDLDLDVGRAIGGTSNLIRRCIDKTVEKNSPDALTGKQNAVLGYIMHCSMEKDVFQKDIERDFTIRGSSATNMLQTLEDKGYLERKPVDYDARLKKLVLTQKAVEEQLKIKRVLDHFSEELQKDISEEELKVFFDVIGKIVKNIDKMEKGEKDA